METQTEKKSITILGNLEPGSIFTYRKTKWKVTNDHNTAYENDLLVLYIYCYPYLPYSQANQSNIGEPLPANLIIKN
jgi:hypothetical protein